MTTERVTFGLQQRIDWIATWTEWTARRKESWGVAQTAWWSTCISTYARSRKPIDQVWKVLGLYVFMQNRRSNMLKCPNEHSSKGDRFEHRKFEFEHWESRNFGLSCRWTVYTFKTWACPLWDNRNCIISHNNINSLKNIVHKSWQNLLICLE